MTGVGGRAALLAGALAVAALPACAGAASAEAVLVSAVDTTFTPATVTVPVGTEVRWVNDGARTHTVTSEPFDSGPLRAGETFTHRFDVPGTYAYWCRFHREEQMLGTVEVVDR